MRQVPTPCLSGTSPALVNQNDLIRASLPPSNECRAAAQIGTARVDGGGSFLVQCACDAVVRVLAELDADELVEPFGV